MRRRVLLAVSSGAILVALALPWGGAGRHPLATPGPVLAGATAHSLYVVQPGDTMWGIAERLDPGGDPRPIVTQLEAQVGSDTLQPGQHLRLP
jgi:LysM repeat protein